jgi:hypothetical protein
MPIVGAAETGIHRNTALVMRAEGYIALEVIRGPV